MRVWQFISRCMKKLMLLFVMAGFSLSTLVTMPNHFNAGRSFIALYNYCLQEDDNMNLLEFIGEKLLLAGFDPTEHQETRAATEHPFLPVPNASAMGFNILFYNPIQFSATIHPCIVQQAYTVVNKLHLLLSGYPGAIFHPPLPVTC
ncbi:hypothetical protein [Hydrotalea flava]|uniref:hypothetical protein n=1 Tax=Hydrotalea flava TaxID=714549 RepID=UPI00142EF1C3|nr:hypothetical protein [Hydrotalea flava]